MNAFVKFNAGMLQMPAPWKLWLGLLLATNLVAPLFFLGTLEARLVLAALFGSMAIMTLLTGVQGFTRLLGAGHVLWVPLLLFLWTRLDAHPPTEAVGLWIRALMVINGASLLIDTVDVARWITGDRAETVQFED